MGAGKRAEKGVLHEEKIGRLLHKVRGNKKGAPEKERALIRIIGTV